jgi:IPT/TIG domain
VRETSRRLLKVGIPFVTPLMLVLGACIASAPEGVRRQTDQDQPEPEINFDGGFFEIDAAPDVGVSDPYAIIGADPAHGPFSGGGRVILRGNGFASTTRVWFGAVEADPTTIVPIDPTRMQVTVPPNEAIADWRICV